MTAATLVMSSLRNGFLNRHPEMAAALLDTEQRSAFDFHPTDDHRTGAAFRVYREDVVACAEFTEILRRASGQIDIGMDGSRVHTEWPGGHVARLDRLRMDQEKARRGVAHEQPFAAPEERGRIDAHTVAEADSSRPRDFRPHQANILLKGFEQGTNGPNLIGRGGHQENAVGAHLHRLEGELRFHDIMDLHEQPGPAPLEKRDQVLERDDLPRFRPDDYVLRRATQRADQGLVLRRADRREPSDFGLAEQERDALQENRRETPEPLE